LSGANVGALLRQAMRPAQTDHRIAGVVHVIENLRVYTAWDLANRDATAVLVVQIVGQRIRLID